MEHVEKLKGREVISKLFYGSEERLHEAYLYFIKICLLLNVYRNFSRILGKKSDF